MSRDAHHQSCMTKHALSSIGTETVQVESSCKARASGRRPCNPKLGILTTVTTPLEIPDGGAREQLTPLILHGSTHKRRLCQQAANSDANVLDNDEESRDTTDIAAIVTM